jgi:hypothetical protein
MRLLHLIKIFLCCHLISPNTKIEIHEFIILPVFLHGCETWSLTLNKERKLRVSEERLVRNIFAPKREAVTGWWRKLHNEELHDLYSSQNIFRMIQARIMRWSWHVTRWWGNLKERDWT